MIPLREIVFACVFTAFILGGLWGSILILTDIVHHYAVTNYQPIIGPKQ
jgi:hypothetical protein